MATNDLVTLSLEGDVPLTKYAEALVKFNTLIQSLTSDVAPNVNIRWMIYRSQRVAWRLDPILGKERARGPRLGRPR